MALSFWLLERNGSRGLAAFASEQRLTPFKNAMEQDEVEEEEEDKKTKWEARAPSSYLISINGFTGDPRDPRKSLRGGFSRRCL